jgi:hypothetical protein
MRMSSQSFDMSSMDCESTITIVYETCTNNKVMMISWDNKEICDIVANLREAERSS